MTLSDVIALPGGGGTAILFGLFGGALLLWIALTIFFGILALIIVLVIKLFRQGRQGRKERY